MAEFDLIKKYFIAKQIQHKEIEVGSGDDCAIVNIPPGKALTLSIDTLVEGVHFSKDTGANDLGYKALAVSLSDLASCGATPHHHTATLTLPAIDEHWMSEFAKGFFACANEFNTTLVGGDVTRGPLSITVQAHGFIKPGAALLRSGAKMGDTIFVSGTLGDARLALEASLQGEHQTAALKKLHRPSPRVALGNALLGIANSAIDLSDGLSQDLSHLLKQSGVGADVFIEQLPLSKAALSIGREKASIAALTGGDDYELCFTVPQDKLTALNALTLDLPITNIGVITDTLICRYFDANDQIVELDIKGFEHFS